MLNLSDAITAVEAAQTGIATADSTKSTAQSKFDAAQASLTQATADDAAAVKAFNDALDALIAAATAAKRS